MAEPTNTLTPPPDVLVDAKGRWVPRSLVKDVDLARHELVLEMVARAEAFSRLLLDFRARALADIRAFVALSSERYGVEVGGAKGNVTLLSFDGRYKVTLQVADHLVFDERLQAAKELVDQCIRAWSEGARDEIRALVEHAFQADKQGKVSTERVLGLRRLNIQDPKWLSAMRAIADSVQVASSKAYVRFYERIGEGDGWRAISLDLASVGDAGGAS